MNLKLLIVGMLIPFSLLFSCSSSNSEEQDKANALQQRENELLEKEAAAKLEIEKLKLEEEKQRLEAERLAVEEDKRREKMAENAKLERNFPDYTEAVVVINKSYFYSKPEEGAASTKKYLISGDYVSVVRTRNGFGYIDYYNENNGKTTSGWLDLRDLEPVYGD